MILEIMLNCVPIVVTDISFTCKGISWTPYSLLIVSRKDSMIPGIIIMILKELSTDNVQQSKDFTNTIQTSMEIPAKIRIVN